MMKKILPLLKKILPLSVLGFSGLMLILAVIDIFADAALFSLLPIHLGTILLLLLSLGLTGLACAEPSLRRPLVLLACLLQTPIGGGLLILYVYEWAFPAQLPLGLLLPFVMLIVSVASALQAGVTILCDGMYAEEAEDAKEDDPPASDLAWQDEEEIADAGSVSAGDGWDDSQTQAAQRQALQEQSSQERPADQRFSQEQTAKERPSQQPPAPTGTAPTPEAEPARTAAPTVAQTGTDIPASQVAPAPVPQITPVAVPVRVAPVEITPEDEDELAPIPKKKGRRQPAFETVTHPVVPVVPKVPAAPEVKATEPAPAVKSSAPKTKESKKAYTDPFGLLTEEVKPETSSVKSIFGGEDADED
ncbi:MAG: hypothetical protein IJX76_06625 [Clostridia bacterium]|nr:hypothetical protein [Clostridia bacterium]